MPLQAETFHPFPGLPYELRCLIWREAFLKPRFIPVFVEKSFNGRVPNLSVKRKRQYHPGIPIRYPILRTGGNRLPLLFCICQETRELASKSYEICLSTVIDPATRFNRRGLTNDPETRTYQPYGSVRPYGSFREAFYQRTVALKSHILPSAIISARIRREHAKYTAKGIYFQPNIDTIYFCDDLNTPKFAFCMENLPKSALKTNNIKNLAFDWELCIAGGTTFQTMCIPHITAYRLPKPTTREDPAFSNVTNFTIVATSSTSCTSNRPRGYMYGIIMPNEPPVVIERAGPIGNLTVSVIGSNEPKARRFGDRKPTKLR